METLTHWEWQALDERLNIADGHARQSLFGHHHSLVDALPILYQDSYRLSQKEVETRFLDSYWAAAGVTPAHHHYSTSFHYSSSLSISTVSQYLATATTNNYLVTPTFDNIPALLKRSSVNFSAVREKRVISFLSGLISQSKDLSNSSIFIVNPNNPTGHYLSSNEFICLCQICAETGLVLIIDNSFRFFRPESSYDDVIVLQRSGCKFIIIEDTGKIFSTSDIKVGFITSHPLISPAIARISDEIMLNVSPFALLLLERVCRDYATTNGQQHVVDLIACNRSHLRKTLRGTGAKLAYSTLGLAWVVLPPGTDSHAFVQHSSSRGLGLLPGNPFFWDRPTAGRRHIRIALMRDEAYFVRAMASLRLCFDTFTQL